MFSYVWLHFKKCFEKYFLVFGCVLENSIENTFSTCCSHFLTFSRLPNEYIISFIPQYRTQTKPRKKSSNPVTFSRLPNNRNTNIPVKYRNTNIFWVRRGAAIGAVLCVVAIDGSRDRDRCEGEIAIGAMLHAILVISADDLGDQSFGRSWRARLSLWRDQSFGRSLYFRG